MPSQAAAYRDFALATLLPLCRDSFADPVHGGFHEQLTPDRQPAAIGSKRLMVQCRQLYVLSHAALLGDRSGAAAAERGYAFLQNYRDRANGGWHFRATPDGAPMDRSKDLYGHAFLLFALAYLHRAFAAPNALQLAGETLDVLKAKLAAPGGGFWDGADETWTPQTGLRRQNPHMHLLEALLALHEASGAARWLDEARGLIDLFLTRFFDPATATLGEYFTGDWQSDPEKGHIVEAGHHYEWVWLLHRWRVQSGDASAAAAADALFAKAERHGFDPEFGGIHDQIDRQGAPLLTTRRIWPVTEAIKAQVARIEAGLPVAADQPDRLIAHLFRDFLRPERHGWIETMQRDGTPIQTNLPGSTPYHMFLAAAEAARVLPPPG